ncbi:MAG: maltotransferase domain-containing protein [Sandaracinaceae bacterium]
MAPQRVVIVDVSPRIRDGAVKRCVGDMLVVGCTLVCDGHGRVDGVLRARRAGDAEWHEQPLVPISGDRFEARVELDAIGTWRFEIHAWVDEIRTWADALAKKAAAGTVRPVELAVGSALFGAAEARARERGGDETTIDELRTTAQHLVDERVPLSDRVALAVSESVAAAAAAHPDRSRAARSERWRVRVDPTWARFAAWYELFPRSTLSGDSHGTLRTAIEWIPYVAGLGFDVVYLPPIHPIGRTHRKGRDNALVAEPGDPGSPWAIGAPEGGHTAVHPELGTLDDFDAFVAAARQAGLRVALDLAFQASPDHPWVEEHPEWFRARPDGSIQYAENPPKQYQDIYPFDFDCPDWKNLWHALRDVVLHWIDHGVTIFRVDNPHTKPVRFWQWCIEEIQRAHPEVTFLAEAFTRPTLKYLLARVGFTQGYTYFTWRRTSWEMRQYMRELTETEVAEYFRPSFWPNTPDILPEDLQIGGAPAFLARLVMAATLSSHYGIYGPAFELMERVARPGTGEYANSEKYEVRRWDLGHRDSLSPWLRRVNRIRREHSALTTNRGLAFHGCDNETLLCYSKRGRDDTILVVVSFDPHHRQSGWVELDLDALDLDPRTPFSVEDLLGGGRYLWSGARNYVELDPAVCPAHVFVVRRYVRTEHDFDYYM